MKRYKKTLYEEWKCGNVEKKKTGGIGGIISEEWKCGEHLYLSDRRAALNLLVLYFGVPWFPPRKEYSYVVGVRGLISTTKNIMEL